MGRKKEGGGLGKSIIKDRFKGQSQTRGKNDSFLHTTDMEDGYDWGRLNLQSVTEQSNLEDFLSTAELAGTEFTAEKMNVAFVTDGQPSGLLTEEQTQTVLAAQEKHRELLNIPRRPPWDETTTAEELQLNERKSFLEWRRRLAELQDIEHLILTPFEKNLEFWRQLWRVIERSDLIVQIVDGRNPLLFRCEDLETYVKEVNPEKVNVVLINKADLLSPEQRSIWATYFDSVGVTVIFWSAMAETERIKMEAEEAALAEEKSKSHGEAVYYDSDEVYDDDEDEGDEEEESDEEQQKHMAAAARGSDVESMDISEGAGANLSNDNQASSHNAQFSHSNVDSDRLESAEKRDCSEKAMESSTDLLAKNNPNLLTGDELLDFFKSLHTGKKVSDGITTVGLVGYPNVGKSSTINAILQTKKVPVSATPGRTKHFQTLFVEPTVMLCDCPGLVMPTFVSTKAEMVVSGILPIDQMRDHIPPVSLVCQYVPRMVLEATYGIMLPKPQEGEEPNRPPTSHEFLSSYGYMRGFMTHKGIPDQPRSARIILKDYMNGKLLYCHPPPDTDVAAFKPAAEASKIHKPTLPQGHISHVLAKQSAPSKSSAVDQQFFSKTATGMGTKGVRKPGPSHQSTSDTPSEAGSSYGSQHSLSEKPWKKHNNKNRKEKLRRVHNATDVHYI